LKVRKLPLMNMPHAEKVEKDLLSGVGYQSSLKLNKLRESSAFSFLIPIIPN